MKGAASEPHDSLVLSLPGCRLPADSGFLRQHLRDPADRDADYLARYDRTTLLYDAVTLPDGATLMTAPRLLNLWPALRDRLQIDGRKPRLRRRVFGKFEFFETRSRGAGIAIRIGGQDLVMPIRLSQAATFAGLRCVLTMNKDNDLRWIRDWAQHHVDRHGLEGVLIFDNGSTSYGPEAIAETLLKVAGLKAIRVVVADFPYGTVNSGSGRQIRPKFLQPAMMNLARRDFLAEAAAVLNVDIDEIVPRAAQSVFDAARSSAFGVIRIPGVWTYPTPEAPMPCRHADHVYAPMPMSRSNYKWCARPGGILDRIHGWNVHRIGGQTFKLLRPRAEFRFLHCRGVSTGWKSREKRYARPDDLHHVPEFEAILPKPAEDT